MILPSPSLLFARYGGYDRHIAAFDSPGLDKHGENHRLYFLPESIGGKAPLSYQHPHWIDLRESGMKLGYQYDPSREDGMITQMICAAWEAVLAGPLASRKIFMHAASSMNDLGGEIRIGFSVEGEPIPGLTLQQNMTAPWTFFVRDEQARQAIDASVRLHLGYARRESGQANIPELERTLEGALAAVA